MPPGDPLCALLHLLSSAALHDLARACAARADRARAAGTPDIAAWRDAVRLVVERELAARAGLPWFPETALQAATVALTPRSLVALIVAHERSVSDVEAHGDVILLQINGVLLDMLRAQLRRTRTAARATTSNLSESLGTARTE